MRCASDMVAELAALGEELQRSWGVRLRMRTGVNTGELVVSGDGELVGDAMNTAARFEQAAAPGWSSTVHRTSGMATSASWLARPATPRSGGSSMP
jgi:class 3 adenylate cyclase